jgi:hypothetical protein
VGDDLQAAQREERKSWQLDCGVINGQRVQISFKTKCEAEVELVSRRADMKRTGHHGLALTDDERVRYFSLRDRLGAVGATFEEAFDYFLSHARPARGPPGCWRCPRRSGRKTGA